MRLSLIETGNTTDPVVGILEVSVTQGRVETYHIHGATPAVVVEDAVKLWKLLSRAPSDD